LIVVGGREDKENGCEILSTVVARARKGSIAVVTVASREPDNLWAIYSRVFRELGAADVRRVDVEERGGASGEEAIDIVRHASGVFFTGGDQVRITSHLGGTALCDEIRGVFRRGGVIGGTSAGASAMSETMLIAGENEQSVRVRESLHMAPGLGLMPSVIIDQHFAERGRMGRLVGAVAQNPRMLGVGIDENTAIVAHGRYFDVIGTGGVYVVDALGESYTNVAEADPEDLMAVFDLRLHILSPGSRFDLRTRRPAPPRPHKATPQEQAR
jgi:cyanophycinase